MDLNKVNEFYEDIMIGIIPTYDQINYKKRNSVPTNTKENVVIW